MARRLSALWMRVGLTALTVLAMTACGPGGMAGTRAPGTPPATTAAVLPAATRTASAPAATPTAPIEADTETPAPTAEWVYGPGDFDLPAPTTGLADLANYRETLTITFEGTDSGQPAQWSRTYVMLVNQAPAARQVTVEATGDGAAQVWGVELEGVRYERRGEADCTASLAETGASLAEQWEPARFLAVVFGAEAAGSDTLDGAAADHYTFDERALGAASLAQSTGELWVAADGGYLLRYVLRTEAGAEYFGEGTEGIATWDYTLSEVNQPLAVAAPEGCPAGRVEAPLLPDAADVEDVPGLLSYTSAAPVADAAAFYQQQLPALGWQPSGEASLNETSAWQEFTQGDEQLSVIIAQDETGTSVRLLLGPIQP